MNTHRPLRTCLLLGIISLAHGVTYAFIQNAGTGISNYLKEVVTTSMQAPYLQGVYNKLPYSKVSIDKLEETTRRAAALTKEFVTYITALDRTEKALQSAYAAAGSQTSLADQTTFDDVEKFNMHNTIWDSKFGFQVNLTRYAYKSAPVVTASVSELGVDTGHAAALASTWKANFDGVSNQLYHNQFVGLPSGMMYMYPGQQWEDSYDARVTDWYSSALVGSKNVILVIDGSDSGKIALHKELAYSVIDTLAPHDYVAVYIYHDSYTRLGGNTCDSQMYFSRASSEYCTQIKSDLASYTTTGSRRNIAGALSNAASLKLQSDCSGQNVVVNIQGGSTDAESSYKSLGSNWKIFTFATSTGVLSAGERDAICDSSGWYEELKGSTAEMKLATGMYYNYMQFGAPTSGSSDERTSFLYGEGTRKRNTRVPSGYSTTEVGDLLTISRAVWSGDTLIGVIGMDIRMTKLKDTLDAMQDGDSFPVMYTKQGETLYHPEQSQYKKTYLIGTGRELGDYEGFETSTFLSGNPSVRDKMLQESVGNSLLTLNRPLPKGDAEMEGIDTKTIETVYSWSSIAMTPFKLCMVMASYDLNKLDQSPSRDGQHEYTFEDHSEPNAATINQDDFAALGLDYMVVNIDNCALNINGVTTNFANKSCIPHPDRYTVGAVTFNVSGTHFAPKCFESPTIARSYSWDDISTFKLRHYINHELNSANSGFPLLRDQCVTSARIARQYQEKIVTVDHSATVWVYWGQVTGTNTLYPLGDWGNEYDPTRRPWYFRAVSVRGDIAVSTPYQDAAGAGLLNTVSITVFKNSKIDSATGNMSDERVAGVIGYDYIYGVFYNLTRDLVGCSKKDVQNHVATDPQPMCFLIDRAGMLLSHSDFLVDEQVASSSGLGVNGEWPIENVFIGEKEPPLASELLQYGFLKNISSLNEDKSQRLHYFETDDSVLDSSGILQGRTIPKASTECGWQGTWNLVRIDGSNAYLMIIENFQRGNLTTCPMVKAPDASSISRPVCSEETGRGKSWCIYRNSFGTEELENFRPVEGSCKRLNFAKYSSTAGILAVALGVLGIVFSLVLWALLLVYRRRYVILATAPTFGYVMCCGAVFSFIYVIMLPGKPSDAICGARKWVMSFGFVLLYMGLIVRSLRILMIWSGSSSKMKVRVITDFYLLRYILAAICVQTLYVFLRIFVGNHSAREIQSPTNAMVYEVKCQSDNDVLYNSLQYTIEGLILLSGVYMGIMTRKVSLKEFNESKHIALAIYNVAIIQAIAIPLRDAMSLQAEAIVFLNSMSTFMIVILTLFLVYTPKFLNLHLRREDFKFTNRARKQIRDYRKRLHTTDNIRGSNSEFSRATSDSPHIRAVSTPKRMVSMTNVKEKKSPIQSSQSMANLHRRTMV